jgi:hypothetical protein
MRSNFLPVAELFLVNLSENFGEELVGNTGLALGLVGAACVGCGVGEGAAPPVGAEELAGECGEGLPELAGGDGVDDRVHQAVGQLGEHDVVAQRYVDTGIRAADAACIGKKINLIYCTVL